jgi:hypothetical protein
MRHIRSWAPSVLCVDFNSRPHSATGRGRSLGLCFSLLVIAFEAGCTLHGRLYNLTTGEVTPVTMTYGGTGRGKISANIASSGEKFSGEYVTLAHVPLNWGSIYAKVYGTQGSSFTGNASLGKSNQYGTAVVTGDKGSVVDCEYVTTALTHGSDACVDKQGTLYKLMF